MYISIRLWIKLGMVAHEKIILALDSLRQKDREFEASLGFMERSCPAPISKYVYISLLRL
jgi:hypothetical protein